MTPTRIQTLSLIQTLTVDHAGKIPISFFESCQNAKNKESLLSMDDINRVRAQELL